MSESRLLREQPMDLGIIKEIDPESFTEIIVDEESKELYNLGEIGQRYAYIRSYKVGYGLTLKKLKKNPELDDLKPNSIGILSEDNQLTVYWIEKGKVVNRSFTEDSVPEIANALHEFAETSNNPSLIKAIISKYECTLQGKWHIRLRPGYPFTIDAKTAEDAQKRFSNRYVIAEQTNIGIVHRKVEKQVTEKEPLLFRPDEMNPRIFQEAGSFWKLKDGKILWINRSTANTNINKKNELALSCFAFSPKKFDFSRPAYTNEFHLRRSSAEDFFCPMANTVTVQLGGNEAIFYSATADCYSFNIAKEWQIICEMKEGPEKILLIQEKLMRTIYISAGIDPDKDNDGLLPLIKNALKVANEEKISLNLDEIPQGFDKKNGTALEMAIKKGYIDVALLLIDNGASINLSCILAAIEKGNNLLLKKIEPHINNMFKSMNLEMLLALIEKGNISFLRRVENIEHLLQSMTPDMALSLSPFSLIKQGEYDLLEQLVAKGLILNKTQLGLCLPHAIKTRDLEMIKKLFALGADPNVLIDSGSTPLQYAVELQVELNIIEELLQKSANPNIDNYGNPLKIAICTNNTNLLELLLRYHADPNKSIDSAFPLTIALRKEDMESINLLLEYKADPTLLSSPPALHLAVQTGNIDIFNKIKAFYSSHTVYDHKGKTPLLIALDYRYVDIANALYLDNKINLETYSNHYEKLNVFASAVKFVMQPKYFSNMEYPKIQRTLDKVISQAYKDFGGYPENKQDISQPLEALINEISHIANSLTTENNGSLFSKNKLLLICQKELFEIIKEYSPSNNSGQQNTINS